MHRYIILFALSMTLMAGCKKDPATAVSTSSRVKTESTTSPTGIAYTVSFTYDSSGRQVQSQTDTVITTYVYAPGTITKTISLAGERFVTGYTTDASGRVTSDSKYFQYGYDANGYLTSLSLTGTGSYDSTVYTISGGDVSTAVEHQVDSFTNNTVMTTYTYLSHADNRDYGMKAFGTANTNLVSSQSISQVNNGSTSTISYIFTYTYDAQGRVTQMVKTSGSSSYTTTYTYY